MDRRARYTKAAIRDAFFDLLGKSGFSKISVTDICKAAQINRGTFYLHYEDKYALLDELIGEALAAGELDEDQAPLSTCQRVPVCERYAALYRDTEVGPRIVERIVRENIAAKTASIRQRAHVTEREATVLFTFSVYGNFAVNKMLGWKHDDEWVDVQRFLRRFLDGGVKMLLEGEERTGSTDPTPHGPARAEG